MVGSEKHVCNVTECIIAVQGHFNQVTKVVDFSTNRKGIFDFLLVINSNLCRISHRYGDTAAYWSKIANSYPPHPHSTPSLGVTPSNFGMSLISAKTRIMGLSCGEEIVIVR